MGGKAAPSTDMQSLVCRACDKGHASFDQRHRLVASTIYDLPFGRGRKFGSNINQAADYVVGGWTVTGITSFATGFPIFITSPASTPSAYISHRPNRLCDGADSSLSDNLRNNGMVYFKTSCFAAPATGFFGNTGRAPLHGPGINNWDIGLEKQFPIPITEQMKLQFRGELFNAFNHAQFNNPNGDTGAGANFGRISSARAPRLIQLGLKLLW